MNEYEKWHKQKETQQHTQLFRQKHLYVKYQELHDSCVAL